MNAPAAWGVLLGTVLGVGLWSLVSLMPRLGRPRLAQRVAPYILDVSAEARDYVGRTTLNPLPVFGSLFSPVVRRLASRLDHLLGGTETLTRQLRQAGSRQSVDEFRTTQLLWALAGSALGLVLVLVSPATQTLPLIGRVLLVATAALCGALLRGWLLQRAARARLARISSELPTVLEFLTLSLSAGEGILDALRRVAATSSGELSRELAGVVADVHTGMPLSASLSALARRIQLPALTRFVDQVTGALDRGTPLAEVLRAQAQDAREEAKRDLLETAGRKEISMMIPLVFLILPLSILFAIFPGLFVLQAGF
ncbi:type II secretion system F family protein [Leifsonia kafniensis]|uniref:Type II secretion system F family protein n=1 Tax=Leifsonia kafniensis TaxID=475957 RepID=A0ABP7KBD6_9MICO